MMRRLLPLVVVGVVVAVAAGAALGLSDGPTALRVGETAISRHDLQHEFELLAGATELGAAGASTPGAVGVNTTRQWILERILGLLAEHRLVRKGGRITAADRAKLSELIGPDLNRGLRKLPDLRQVYQQIYVPFLALARVEGYEIPSNEGNPLGNSLKSEARRVKVTLDPRYGVWVGDTLAVARPGAVLSRGPG